MRRLRTVALILLVNTAGGCLPAVFMFLFQPRLPGRVFLRECEIGCLYSFCIGTLCFAVMERIGKRVVSRRRAVQVPLLLAIFTLLALLGSIPPALICVAAGWLDSAS